jgi:cation transport regulator ChaB
LPYASIEDLPPPVQRICRPTRREATAHRVAWAAVKHKDRKSGDQWVPRDPG